MAGGENSDHMEFVGVFYSLPDLVGGRFLAMLARPNAAIFLSKSALDPAKRRLIHVMACVVPFLILSSNFEETLYKFFQSGDLPNTDCSGWCGVWLGVG